MASGWHYILAALTLASSAPSIAQDVATDWDALKKESEARKAAADAEKAEAEARTASIKSQLGGLADLESLGNTTAANTAGQIEAAVLSAEATRSAAKSLVEEVCAKAPQLCAVPTPGASTATTEEQTLRGICDDLVATADQGPPKLYIYSEAERPVFDTAEAVQAALCGISRKLDVAISNSARLDRGGASTVLGPAAIFTIATTAAKLFRSDYNIQGVAVTPDDLLLAKLFVAEATGRLTAALFVPSLYRPAAMSLDNPLVGAVSELNVRRDSAVSLAERHRAESARLGKQKGNAGKAKAHADVAAQLAAATKAYDDYVTRITTPSDKGISELAEAARQMRIRRDLSAGSLLVTLKMNAAGGSDYTKKNFWTFLGGAPFFVSGGSLASYALFDGRTGAVLGAGAVGNVSDFRQIGTLHRK